MADWPSVSLGGLACVRLAALFTLTILFVNSIDAVLDTSSRTSPAAKSVAEKKKCSCNAPQNTYAYVSRVGRRA